MSILRYKQKLFADGGVLRTGGGGSGGGGSPGPSTTYSQTSNIPDYAQPYVENMLQSAQTQVYNDDMTSFRPYTPYSSDVNNYFAGFSPLQQSAQQAAWNLQVPQQYGLGSQLSGVSGLGSLSTTGQALDYGAQGAGYGGMGAGLGLQAAGAGQQYAMGATDPRTTQAYMSPYMQNVVDYQKSQALRDYQMGQPLMAKAAVGQGAFGGNRLALQQAEAQRGLMSQLQGIEATGAQSAFQNAQQAQQFGANLGLQGLQAGMQGTAQGIQGAQAGLQGVQGALAGYGQANQAAGTLGQLGTQQLGAEQSIINTQSQQGAQQQALEQNKINQAIQDYAIQQQYPMMQLGFLSNMLRGLPMQAQTTQMFQAQPSALQQGIGLAGAGASLFGAGRSAGGEIKEMAEGGIAGYKYGGAIPEAKLAGMAENLSIQQLQQRLADKDLDSGERQIFADALQDKARLKARSEGIAAAGGGLFNTMGYAGGGILAFEDGGEVEHFQNKGSVEDKEERSAFMQDLIDTFGYSGASDSAPEMPGYLKRAGEYFTKPRAKPTPTIDSTPNQAEIDAIRATNTALPAPGPTQAQRDAFYETSATGSKGSTGAQPSGQSSLGGILAGLRKEGPKGELGADYLEKLKGLEEGADQRLSKQDRIAMAKGFLKFGATPAPGGIGQAAVAGLGEYTEGYAKALESDEKFRMENAKLQSDIENLRRAEERGDVKLAAELQDKIADRANRLQQANISASASGRAGAREDAYVKQLMAQGMSLEQALQAVKGAGRAEANSITATKEAIAGLQNSLLAPGVTKEQRAEIQQQISMLNNRLVTLGSGGSQAAASGGGGIMRFDAQGNLVKG